MTVQKVGFETEHSKPMQLWKLTTKNENKYITIIRTSEPYIYCYKYITIIIT